MSGVWASIAVAYLGVFGLVLGWAALRRFI